MYEKEMIIYYFTIIIILFALLILQFFSSQVFKLFKKMSTEVKRVENSVFGVGLWVITQKDEAYFMGKEIAPSLGFKKPRNAIDNHVDKEDKMTLKDLLKGGPVSGPPLFVQNMQPDQIVIKEMAFFNLCLRSSLPEIKPFQRWVYEMIRDIRRGTTPTLEKLSLEDTPIEMIKKTVPQIPSYDSSEEGDNFEREEMHDSYKEGFDESKDKKAVERGAMGGSKTQENIRDLKRFVRNFYIESSELEEKDINSKIEFLDNFKKEAKEICEKQNLLKNDL